MSILHRPLWFIASLLLACASVVHAQSNPTPLGISGPTGAALTTGSTLYVQGAVGVARPVQISVSNPTPQVIALGSSVNVGSSHAVTATLSGDGADDFTIAHPLPATLEPGATKNLVIAMLPKATGRTATLTLHTDGYDDFTVQLQGNTYTGGPALNVRCLDSGVELGTALSNSIYIGAPLLNTARVNPNDTLVLTNYGDADLTDLKVTLPAGMTGVTATLSTNNGLRIGESATLRLTTSTNSFTTGSGYLVISGNGGSVQFSAYLEANLIIYLGNTGTIISTGTISIGTPILVVRPIPPGPVGVTTTLRLRLGEEDSGAVSGATISATRFLGGSSFGGILANPTTVTQGAPTYTSTTGSPAAAKFSGTLGAHFDGASSLRPNLNFSSVDNFALEAWVRPASATGTQAMVYHGTSTNGYGFYQVDDTLRCRIAGVGDIAQTTFTLGDWVHLAIVRKSGVSTFYVNGKATGSTSTAAHIAPSMGITSGATADGHDFFTGDVDEVTFSIINSSYDPNQTLTVNQSGNPLILSQVAGNKFNIVTPPVDFGGLLVGQTKTLALTLSSARTLPIGTISASIQGADSSAFTLTQAPQTSLVPFGYSSVLVTFNASTVGPQSGTLHLTAGADSTDIPLTGSGTLPPEIVVEDSNGNSLVNNAGLIAFSTTNGDRTLTIRNTGDGPLTNLSAQINGGSAQFTVSAPPATIAPGGSATLTVSYHAMSYDAGGARLNTALLMIYSNDQDENPFAMDLNGPGAARLVAETQQGGQLTNHRDVINFSRQPEQIINLKNTGASLLGSISATITGANASDFTITRTPPATLSPFVSTSTILPPPAAPAQKKASSVVATQRAFVGNIVNLLDWSSLTSGSYLGSSSLNLNLPTLGSGLIWDVSRFLPQGVTIKFNPSADGIRNATLHVVSDDPSQSPFDIALVGRRDIPMPEIDVLDNGGSLTNNATINLGAVYTASATGTSRGLTHVFTIHNIGNGALTGLRATFDAANTAFSASISYPTPWYGGAGMPIFLGPPSVQPNGTMLLTVTYDGSKPNRSATLYLASNDCDESPFVLNLGVEVISPPVYAVRLKGEPFLAPGSNLNMPGAEVGKSSSLTLEVVNQGNDSVTGLATQILGPQADEFTVSRISPTLAKIGKSTLTLTFKPIAEGPRVAKLHIYHDNGSVEDFILDLAGFGTKAPVLNLTAQPMILPLGGSTIINAFSPPIMYANGNQLTAVVAQPAPKKSQALHTASSTINIILGGSLNIGGTATGSLNIIGGVVSPWMNMIYLGGSASSLGSVSDALLNLSNGSRAEAPVQTYQWLKDGKPIKGATSETYEIKADSLDAAGRYSFAVTNVAGTVIKDAINCAVVDPTIKEAPAFVGPGKAFTLSVDAKGSDLTYQWTENGAPMSAATSKARITPTMTGAVQYACQVGLAGTGGISTLPVTINVLEGPPVVIDNFGADPGIVLTVNLPAHLPLQTERTATSFGLRGQPPGLSIDKVTGEIGGIPTKIGNYSMTVWAENQAGRSTMVWPVKVVPINTQVVGSFTGIVEADQALNNDLGGLVHIDTTSAGTYSGRLLMSDQVWSLAGKFDGNGADSLTATFTLPAKGDSPALLVVIEIGLDGDRAVMNYTISSADGNASVAGYSLFKRTAPPSEEIGRTNIALFGRQPNAASSTMSLVFDSKGVATATGILSDGSPFTITTDYPSSAIVPLYQSLYRGRGSVRGMGTELTWVKKATPGDRSYPEGWSPTHLSLSYSGRYLPPASGRFFNERANDSSNQARFQFTGGGLSDGLILGLKLTPSRYTVLSDSSSTSPDLDPKAFWFSINANTGFIIGGFSTRSSARNSPGRKASFTGLLIPDDHIGVGNFSFTPVAGQTVINGLMQFNGL